MNYQKIYDQLIEQAKTRNSCSHQENAGICFEKHHVIPRALGGKDTKENLVSLTLREHFVAHLLYEKISAITYGKNSSQHNAMITALNFMSSRSSSNMHISSRLYSRIKAQFIEVQRRRMSGANNPMHGHSCTEYMTPQQVLAWRQKHQGENHQFYGKRRPLHSRRMSGANNPMYGHSVKEFMTDEQVLKWKNSLSKSNSGENNGFFGKHHTDQTKQKIRAGIQKYVKIHGHGPTFGKKISKEASRHLSELRRGKKKTEAQLMHFNKIRIEKHFALDYDLSEFDYKLYVHLSNPEKTQYRKKYFSTHKRQQTKDHAAKFT